MIRCTHCATDNLDGSEYCDECGTKLSGSANASAGRGRPVFTQPPQPQFITQVAPPPPAFTKDSGSPQPATPFTPPPPPPPVHPPVSSSASPQALHSSGGRPLPPPPSIPGPSIKEVKNELEESKRTLGPAPPIQALGKSPAQIATTINGQKGGIGGEIGKYDEGKRPVIGNDNQSGGDLQVRAKLVIQRGGKVGKEFLLLGSESMIGRWDADGGIFPDVDLDQDDPEAKVSRRHARIQFLNNQFLIEDLGSTNGTFINRGPRLLPGNKQPLNHGDEIIVGKTFLKFVLN